MNTRSTTRATRTFWLVPGPLLILVSVVLGVSAAQESQGLVEQRGSTCDGTIPMPTSAFALGWAAVAVAVLATVALLIGRCSADPAPLSHLLYDSSRVILGVAGVVALLLGAVTAVWTVAIAGMIAGVIAIAAIAAVTSRHRSGRARSTTSEMRHQRAARPFFVVFLALAMLALLFTGFTLHTVYGDAPAVAHLCFG